jgi:hypothetical protein
MESKRTPEEREDAEFLRQYKEATYQDLIAMMRKDKTIHIGNKKVTCTTTHPLNPFQKPVIYEIKILDFPRLALDFLINKIITSGIEDEVGLEEQGGEVTTIGNYIVLHSQTKNQRYPSGQIKARGTTAVKLAIDSEPHPSINATKINFRVTYTRTQKYQA